MDKVVVRDAYTEFDHGGIDFKDTVSMTKQEFKDECDINKILERYEKGGTLPQLMSEPQYGDFSASIDYRDSCDIVRIADEQFMALDAKVRARFENDPAKFLAYIEQPNEEVLTKAEARKHGILKPLQAEPAPQKVEIVNQKAEGK